MIDTYFDRCDAANDYKSTASRPIWEDPRYYNGSLYSTLIDRNVAEAKANLASHIDQLAMRAKSVINIEFVRIGWNAARRVV